MAKWMKVELDGGRRHRFALGALALLLAGGGLACAGSPEVQSTSRAGMRRIS
jgi:hypothetical protein